MSNDRTYGKYFQDIMEQNALNIPVKDKFMISGCIKTLDVDSIPFTPLVDALKDIKTPFNIEDLIDIYCGYMWIFFVTKYDVYISYTKSDYPNKYISFEKLIFPKDISFTPSLCVKKIASGCDHSIILLSNGKLFSLGKNNDGQLGAVSDNPSDFIVDLVQLSPDNFDNQQVIDVVCGYYHTLAFTKDGTLYVTGRNTESQIGYIGKNKLFEFTKITYADENDNINQESGGKCLDIVKIASSSHNGFFLTRNGTLYGTGDKRFYSMGQRHYKIFKPIQISQIIGQSIVDIWCTSLSTFLKLRNGKILMTGSNIDMAMFTNDSCVEEFKINEYLSNKYIKQIRGYYSTIALSSNNNIYVSGFNSGHQLMNNDKKNLIGEHNLELSYILQKYPHTPTNIQSGFRACAISLISENRCTKDICRIIYNMYRSISENNSRLSDIDIFFD